MESPVVLHGIGSEIGGLRDVGGLAELRDQPDLAETLMHLGISTFAESDLSVTELALRSCRQSLARAGVEAEAVDAFVLASSSFVKEDNYRLGMRRLHAALGLSRAHPVGLFGSECSNLLTALRSAADMLLARKLQHVLVVTSDRTEAGLRLMDGFVSIFSDGAASCLLSRGGDRGFLVEALTLHSSIEMADVFAKANVMAYLKGVMNGARRTVAACLQEARLEAGDFQQVITGNYNRSVLRTYSSQLGFDESKMYRGIQAGFAHAYAADTLIGVNRLVEAGQLTEGDRCLLLGTGHNTWGAAAVRVLGRD